MDIQLFDNFEDDGQLSMFDMAEDLEELSNSVMEESGPQDDAPKGAAGAKTGTAGGEIRIRKCSTCGKILYVKEEGTCYSSFCNTCGIHYSQKI